MNFKKLRKKKRMSECGFLIDSAIAQLLLLEVCRVKVWPT